MIAQIIISVRSKNELYAKLERQSETADLRIEHKIEQYTAVTDTKLEELTREVREHNSFAKRVPILEAKMQTIEKKVGL